MPIPIQNRILLGVTFFVGIMLLVGWITINEPGRMQVFTDQYHGRSIENGAAIFLSNCSTCHGVDAKGKTGVAPALMNPMLFTDKNPAAEAKAAVADAQSKLDAANTQVKKVTDEQTALTTLQQQLAAETDAAKKTDLQSQVDKATAALKRDQDNLATFQKAVTDAQAALDKANADFKALTDAGWDATRLPRILEVGWGGTLQSYVTDAVAAGRPLSGSYWNGTIMPTWGQAYGGPLRLDQIDDVVAYVLNLKDQALKLSPKDVNQQFAVPQAAGAAVAGAAPKVFVQFPKAADQKVDNLGNLSGGDATKGEALYTSLGCAACHSAGTVGPITKGTATRVTGTRLSAADYKSSPVAETTADYYIAQSILYPNAYVVPTYNGGVMPQAFGDNITLDDLKNLIAYLESQK